MGARIGKKLSLDNLIFHRGLRIILEEQKTMSISGLVRNADKRLFSVPMPGTGQE